MKCYKMINLINVNKVFESKNSKNVVLKNINLNFEKGKFYAIMGHSGSGKSTLINIIGLLDGFTYGEYLINGKNVNYLTENEMANLRKKYIGFIFQDFNLDEYLKAYEHVIFPMLINKDISKSEREVKACNLLNYLDLGDRINHYPRELSGGECQRVAIARSLANNPEIILADEPTGNLDEENEQKVFSILKKLSKEGKCVIVVSHSNEVKKYADIIYRLEKGSIIHE